jgi:hypothetical protein
MLGDLDHAERCWQALETMASALRMQPDRVDYFATSVPELSLFGVDLNAIEGRAAELERLALDGRARSVPVSSTRGR